MPGEIPFFVTGKISAIRGDVAYVKIQTGNVYNLYPWTPGIEFTRLTIGQVIECEVTSMLIRVLSAKLKEENK